MPRPAQPRANAVAEGAVTARALRSCGSDRTGSAGSGAPSRPNGGVVDSYTSLRGAPAREKDSMTKAMRLAFDAARGRTGSYDVRWRELNRSTNPSGAWSEEQVAAD